jgi:hypothetical protein
VKEMAFKMVLKSLPKIAKVKIIPQMPNREQDEEYNNPRRQ